MNYSYVMGSSNSILKLEKDGFIIEEDAGDYMISFPKGKEEVWEEFIIDNLSNGYWNEYIGQEIVFIFNLDGNIKKYILSKDNENEVLKLCCRLAETEFISIKDMILGNSFYKEKLKDIKIN